MVQQRPDDDPTGEEEALEFDGAHTDQLDDTYRSRVVASSESPSGTVAFDDRGQSHWKWITEVGPAGDASGTFDQLKALENPALSLEEDAAPPAAASPAKTGYDPYSTGVFEKPKIRR
jgi:hypothetical protein